MKILSQEELRNIVVNLCTRCGFCNTICSIYNTLNRLEVRGPRGRVILLKGVCEDIFEFRDLLEELYTCALCGGCLIKCPAGIDVPSLVLSARKILSEKGTAPNPVLRLVRNVLKTGNIFGFEENSSAQGEKRGDILYWRGCMMSYRLPGLSEIQLKLISSLDYSVCTVSEVCCGSPLILAGFIDEAKKLAEKIVKTLSEINPSALVTGCPSCFHTLKYLYPEVLGIELPTRILHISQLLKESLDRIKIEPVSVKNIAYHDPCELARHCGVIEEPRAVLEKFGYRIIGPTKQGLESTCCGGGGLMWGLFTDLAIETASRKITNEILPLKVDTLVTACPVCLINFKYASILKGFNLNVLDLCEIVSNRLANSREYSWRL